MNSSGPITKIATLHTNDAARPNIILSLVANVLTEPDGGPVKGVILRQGKHIGPIFVGPGVHQSLSVSSGQKRKAEFTITAERGSIKILRVEGNDSHFVKRIEAVEKGKRYKLIVEAAQPAVPGSYGEQLQIITDSAVLPYFRVSVYLTVDSRQ